MQRRLLIARAAKPKLVGAVVETSGECLIDCGLLDVTQPKSGCCCVVAETAFHALAFRLARGHWASAVHPIDGNCHAQCSGEFFASDNITRYARSLAGCSLSQRLPNPRFCSDNRKSGILDQGDLAWGAEKISHGVGLVLWPHRPRRCRRSRLGFENDSSGITVCRRLPSSGRPWVACSVPEPIETTHAAKSAASCSALGPNAGMAMSTVG